tara:strand:- start:308 stop:1948 length:1641 start_codon:yes stop_codon:yes gene_type:complete
MATTIQFRRGTEANAPTSGMAAGEPLFSTDNSKFYIATGASTKTWVAAPILDQDDLSTNSATSLATQQSIKAYVDAQVDTADAISELADVTVASSAANELLFTTGANTWVNYTLAEAGIAALASPTFTGTPAAPTASADTNTTQIATTAYVQGEISGFGTGDSDMAFSGSTANGICTYGGADQVDVESLATYDGSNQVLTMTSTSSGKPQLFMQGSNASAGPYITLKSTATGADDYVCGTLQMLGDDDQGNANVVYAQLDGLIEDASDDNEKGRMSLKVATENNGTLVEGLAVVGTSTANIVDVTLGAGATSTTTVSGNLTVNGTTTTIESTTLSVTDDIITVSKGNDTLANANGSGIEIDVTGGTDIHWKYVHANTALSANTDIDVASGKVYKIAGSSILTATTLASAVQIPVECFNSGTSASSSTFLRGDGTWVAPPDDNTTYSFPGALNGMTTTEVTPAAADKILILDASDSDNVKNVTYSDFATSTQGGTADSAVQPADTFYIGTTQIAHNRASGALTLAGLTLTTPDIGTPSAFVLDGGSY